MNTFIYTTIITDRIYKKQEQYKTIKEKVTEIFLKGIDSEIQPCFIKKLNFIYEFVGLSNPWK